MSKMSSSRTQRREMKRLATLVEKATNADRLYFERFPDREHRIRYAYTAEIQQEQIIHGEKIIAEPGYRIFTIVKNLCRGSRLRILRQGPEHADVDVSEAEARDIYEAIASTTLQVRMVEAEMRALSCGEAASS